MVPPKVKCLTKIWHPNITETGEICLSLLREHSIDGTGWAPTRTLKDVVWGLNSLFTDLLNFDDPLNIEAAEHHLRDKVWKISGTKWMNTSNAMPDDKRRDYRSEDFVTVVSDVKQLEVALLPILILPVSPLGLSQSCDHVVLKKTILLTTQYSKKVCLGLESIVCFP
ncbi:hypothetical protein A6R68_06453 [Neotoma lepida]|uniref:UBC core domain-containing protein n=1 Tax=Neotoma lepida TaxID=56216 RepID=A0A1A6GGM4_NEOLE|nr:hypothetical protein A6R68_06453 [Neotoma lepida]